MKKIIISISLVIAAMLCSTSCSDYLDIVPEGTPSMDNAFSNRINSFKFLHTCYSYLPSWDQGGSIGFLAGDEHWLMPKGTGFIDQRISLNAWEIGRGEQNNNDPYQNFWDGGNGGTNLWVAIRDCNIFLENINKPLDLQNYERTRWIAEVKFLKAYYHYYLFMLYGPIPIMDHALKMDDEMTYFPRNTFDQCVDFIVSDCQYGIDGALPMIYTNASGTVAESLYGRATKAAAYALKARVLLYAASPLFNGNADYAKFANEDGTLLFAPKDDSKWGKAAAAAKEAIDKIEGSSYYGLYYSDEPDNGYRNYMELFLPSKKWNKEYIFARNQGTGYSDNIHQEKCMAANGMGGWSGLCPTQELVDAYEMANGSTPIIGYNADGTPIINGASGYSETGFAATAGKHYPAGVYNMYVGREPRFYASINFNGQQWRGRQLEFWQGGKDGINVSKVDYCCTGYLLRKTADEGVDVINGKGGMKEASILFRVGSLYLDYAEALNEAEGPVDDVYKYVDAIRKRAGLPGLAKGLDKDKMRERIQHERQIELAFEAGHRYFDCHRWKIAEKTDNGYMHGMNITATNKVDYSKRSTVGDSRVFEKKHYLFPIPQSEMDKRIGLVQSPYWE